MINIARRASLLILPLFLLAASAFAQEKNGAAGKVDNENWCGSNGIVGYWTNDKGVAGALALTNAHVATTRINDAMSITVVMESGQARQWTAYNMIAAYSNRDAVDWAIVFIPGLTADSGIVPIPLSKQPVSDKDHTFTGSPRCIWPQTTKNTTLVQGAPGGVEFWMPVSIGGESGSNLWRTVNGRRQTEILLTWSWSGKAAGQPTSLIYNNVQNKNNIGPVRPEGLIEVGYGVAQCEDGYFESEVFETMAIKVTDLPIWADEDDVEPPPPDGKLTPEEIAAVLNLKAGGFDLVRVAEHHLQLLLKKKDTTFDPTTTTTEALPDATMLTLTEPFVEPVADTWTEPLHPDGKAWEPGTQYLGREVIEAYWDDKPANVWATMPIDRTKLVLKDRHLQEVCDDTGQCRWIWVK